MSHRPIPFQSRVTFIAANVVTFVCPEGAVAQVVQSRVTLIAANVVTFVRPEGRWIRCPGRFNLA